VDDEGLKRGGGESRKNTRGGELSGGFLKRVGRPKLNAGGWCIKVPEDRDLKKRRALEGKEGSFKIGEERSTSLDLPQGQVGYWCAGQRWATPRRGAGDKDLVQREGNIPG